MCKLCLLKRCNCTKMVCMQKKVIFVCLLKAVEGFHKTLNNPSGNPLNKPLTKTAIKLIPTIYGPCRFEDITFEHIVPRSLIVRHTQPFKSNLVSAKQRCFLASNDLHNILPAPKFYNHIRSSMKFSEMLPDDILKNMSIERNNYHYVGYGNYIDMHSKTFIVNPVYRGKIARCIMYMTSRWGCHPDLVVEGGQDTLWKWNKENPVDDNERLHNYVVFKLQGTTNKFISNYTDGASMLREFKDVRL